MPVVLIRVTFYLLLWKAPVKVKMRAATATLCLVLLLPALLETRAPLGALPGGAMVGTLGLALGGLKVGWWVG